jgi:hypothetical protein
MPTKVRGRSTISRRPEVCLPMAARQKNESPKGVGASWDGPDGSWDYFFASCLANSAGVNLPPLT